ncbi:MAG: cyclic nucleotide-binding domain-containing protein [Methylococcaceae bacterium]
MPRKLYRLKNVPLKALSYKLLNAGDYLFHEQDTSNDLYLINSGKVEIYKIGSAKKHSVSALGAGEICGELAFLDDSPRSASARGANNRSDYFK